MIRFETSRFFILAAATALLPLGAHASRQPKHRRANNPKTVTVTQPNLRTVTIDAADETGTLRSLQGFDGSAKPLFPGYSDLHKQFDEVGVDFVRMHDFFGIGEIDSDFELGNGDIYNAESLGHNDSSDTSAAVIVHDFAAPRVIFPNPDADPNNPASYNFTATDAYVKDIVSSKRKILFRFGRSQGVGGLIPKDFAKYAQIARHIAMHYERGWDNGMIGAVGYYEVWNEPDLGPTQWTGTAAQYYEFYTDIARAVKAAVPEAQIGGPVADFPDNITSDYVTGFVEYVATNKVPLDFFAWHYYAESYDPYDYYRLGTSIRTLLDDNGLKSTQQFVTEWSNDPSSTTDTAFTQTTFQAAFVTSAMSYMQDGAIDHAFYFRGDSLYLGMFSAGGAYTPTARAFQALGQLNDTPVRLAATGGDTLGYTILAGRSKGKDEVQVLISNYQYDANYLSEVHATPAEDALSLTVPANSPKALQYFGGPPSQVANTNVADDSDGVVIPDGLTPQTFNYVNNQGYDLTIKNLPWGNAAFTIIRYRIDATHNLDKIDETQGQKGSAHLTAKLPAPSVELVVLRKR
jgi:xylan 1,4-beta-xylosidase